MRRIAAFLSSAALAASCALGASAQDQPAAASDVDALIARVESGQREALALLGGSPAARATAYLRAYRGKHPDAEEATLALARVDDRDVIRSLVQTLRDPRPDEKSSAYATLAAVGDRWALQLLVMQLEDARSARRVAPILARLVADPPTPATQTELTTQEVETWRTWARGRPAPPAALAWEATSVTLRPLPEEDSGSAIFSFRNDGARAVEVLAVQTSCSCTTTTLDPLLYPPGASGHIGATYDFGTSSGAQTRKITLFAMPVGGDRIERQVLELRADIPPLCDCRPRILSWKIGEPATPKTVEIDELPGRAGHVEQGELPEGFTCELTPRAAPTPGGHWLLTVTPRDMSKASSAAVPIGFRFDSGKRKEQPIWVFVGER